jgi:hypothetical protein
LAASGAVVVTNRYGLKRDLDAFSKNIICSEIDVNSLVMALRDGVALATNQQARLENYRTSGLNRDWTASFASVIDTLSRRLCS